MTIENNVIVGFDKTDKNLFIPKTVVGADYAIADLSIVEGFDSITVEEGNEHFYMQDGCVIWQDKKALILSLKIKVEVYANEILRSDCRNERFFG